MTQRKEPELEWDTANIKACPHGYVFLIMCDECNKLKEEKQSNDPT